MTQEFSQVSVTTITAISVDNNWCSSDSLLHRLRALNRTQCDRMLELSFDLSVITEHDVSFALCSHCPSPPAVGTAPVDRPAEGGFDGATSWTDVAVAVAVAG